MTQFADELFRAFTPRHAASARRVESPLKIIGTRLFCGRPTCREMARNIADASPGTPVVLLTQFDLDELARREGKPQTCDRCGAALTATVTGPDARD